MYAGAEHRAATRAIRLSIEALLRRRWPLLRAFHAAQRDTLYLYRAWTHVVEDFIAPLAGRCRSILLRAKMRAAGALTSHLMNASTYFAEFQPERADIPARRGILRRYASIFQAK